MLFLRDIQVDIQMRCRDCGHEGVLSRPDLQRRFGPNYPVLSIAPHYRCSRCQSREVESRPVQEAASFAAAAPEPEDFGGALGALQGLLQAVRGGSQDRPRDGDGVQDLMDDDLLDTMVEEPEEDDSPLGRTLAALRSVADDVDEDEPPRPDDDRREAEVDAFDELMAKLAPARSYDEDEDEVAAPAPPPAPPKPRNAAPADSPLDETLAALRALTFAPDAEEDEDREDDPWEDDLGDDGRNAVDDAAPEDLDDLSDEEIVSFAIRDPDARAEPEAEPDSDEDIDDEPFPLPIRRPPPQPGSLDESLAALRALVEKAASDEPEPDRARPAPAPAAEEPETEEPEDDRPPLKTAQEKSLEETLAQLRGMLDLDNGADEGEPVVKPRRR